MEVLDEVKTEEEGEVELSERDTLVGYMFLLQNLKRRYEEELTEMERQALDFALWLLYERLSVVGEERAAATAAAGEEERTAAEDGEERSGEDLSKVRSVRELVERRRAADAR
ncbi:MAG TPA: hypothetical protein ENF26_03390 [Methanomicrobia archaeon]|mgnify:CR=1 FL=1|nr:hypothetical protein [Methanomicrobia archaeon]HEX59174.1 hypothetical protein [Methanomicrobia archaeon]